MFACSTSTPLQSDKQIQSAVRLQNRTDTLETAFLQHNILIEISVYRKGGDDRFRSSPLCICFAAAINTGHISVSLLQK